MQIESFFEKLQNKTNLKVSIKVKDYKSTFISILKNKNELKISFHKLFLNGDENIEKDLFSYCLFQDKKSLNSLKIFADKNFQKEEKILDENKINFEGDFYNLKQILENLNNVYFQNKLNLKITYFQKPKYKKFRHITFGQYDKKFKLIRINKLLDSDKIPFYFINFVVYHEMLHDIHPVYLDNNRRVVHSKEFKISEKKFPYFNEVIEFEKIFLKKRKKHGWT